MDPAPQTAAEVEEVGSEEDVLEEVEDHLISTIRRNVTVFITIRSIASQLKVNNYKTHYDISGPAPSLAQQALTPRS